MNEERATLKRLKLLPVLFRKQDAEKIAPHAGIFLSRAAKKGLIHRINRGNYINSFLKGFPSIEEVACFIRPPSYISCEWALNFHGISLQSPIVCTVVTMNTSVGKNRRIEYNGVMIEFSRIIPKRFNHFSFHNGFYVALPEKAIIDTLYYRGTIAAIDELEFDEVNVNLLFKMCKDYPATLQKKVHALRKLI